MPVKGQAKVVINRAAVSEIDMAMVRGLELLAVKVLQVVEPPDAASGTWSIDGSSGPRTEGIGLVDRGGFLSYVDGKRVGGDPEVRRKPRGFLVRGRGVSVAVGFGFPGRFNELGTIHQPPRPFLTPAVIQVVQDQGAVEGALRTAFAAALESKRRRLIRYQAKAAAAAGGAAS